MSVLSRLSVKALLFTRRLSKIRGYGSAAVAQLDYDYYYNEDEDELKRKGNCRAIAELEERENVVRGVQWVIMGDPMVSRQVYAERLAKLLEVPHISMGTLVRQELNPNSPLYKQISGAVNEGRLVPEDVIFGLLSKRLDEGYCRGESGFILDGFPRTRMQAEILDEIADIDLVLNLKCTEEYMARKTLGNGLYSPSQEFRCMPTAGFSLSFQRISDPGTVSKQKLSMHEELRKPLEEYYKQQNKLLDFHVAAGAPGDTWKGLLAALQLSNSSHKLTA